MKKVLTLISCLTCWLALASSGCGGGDAGEEDTLAPVTSASPRGGTYGSAQTVTLACDDGAGSGCAATHYTTDGSTPTTSSPTYSAPISIAVTTQLRFFSVDNAGNQEAVKSEAYVIQTAQDTTPPVTSASPRGGTFSSAQNVTLSCDDGGGSGCAATHYTTDGSTPTTSSPTYSAPISIAVTTQLRFFSVDNAGNQEAVKSEAYVINAQQNTPPVADAGADQEVAAGTQVQLDGTGSSDADGDALTYTWSMASAPAGFSGALDDPTSPTPSFTANVAGEYRLQLTVNDGQDDSSPDEIIVTARGTPRLVAMYPAWGTPIGSDTQISLTFDQSMDPGHVVMHGDLEVPGAWQTSWASQNFPNDQLLLSPNPAWNVGFDRTLRVDLRSAVGVPLDSFSIPYDVIDAAGLNYLFVNGELGSDNNTGLTAQAPKKTIRAAVEAATPPAAVLVACGDYEVNSDPAVSTHVVLRDRISLFAGFAPNFAARNFYAPTRILDQSTATGVINAAVEAPNGSAVTPATVLDGFEIRAGGGTACAAIRLDNSSPLVRRNVIGGGSGCSYSYGAWLSNGSAARLLENVVDGGTSTQMSAAVNAENSQMLLERNTLNGGTTTGAHSFGVYTRSSIGDVVRNNVIRGDSASSGSYGAHVDGVISVLNNTIGGGQAGYSVALAYNLGTAEIKNNILFTTTATYRTCIMEVAGGENPAALHNNDLIDCPTALYVDFVGSGGNCPFWSAGNCLTTADAVNALSDMSQGSSGNVSLDPVFANPAQGDFHLTASSPAEVREGGLDLSALFNDDYAGATRTVPWSMGAYEQD